MGGRGTRFESSVGVGLRKEPIGNVLVDRQTQMDGQGHGAGGRVKRAGVHAGAIAPGAICAFQAFQAADQFEHMGRDAAQILVRAESSERAIGSAVGEFGVAFVAAVGFAK